MVEDDGTFVMIRRAKIMLDAVPADITHRAVDAGVLVGAIGLSNDKGNPVCAAMGPRRSSGPPGPDVSMRRLVFVAAIASLAFVALLTLPTPSAPPPAAAAAASESVAPERSGVRLTPLHLPVGFVAQQIAAAAGKVWVLGSAAPDPNNTQCFLEEVTPATMATTRVSLPACATYITAGDGLLYLVAETTSPADNIRAYHVEVFDPATSRGQVLTPVVLSNVGSAVAHMGFTYGDGALWLYGYSYPAAEPAVVQISPTTGVVESTIRSVPQIGGTFPTVAADRAGTWLGGGPGGAPGVDWVRPGAAVGTTAYAGPAGQNSSVLWLSAVGDRVWAGIAAYRQTNGPGRISVTTHLVALRPDGTVAVSSPAESTSDTPPVTTAGDASLWGLAVGSTCGRPERLVQIDQASGRVRTTIPLPAAPNSCDAGGGNALLAAVGRDVFALVLAGAPGGSVLYRAAP